MRLIRYRTSILRMNFWQNIRILTTLRVRDGLFTSGQLSVVRDGKFTSRNFSFLHERNLRRDNFLSSNFQLPDRPIFAIPLSLPCMATAAASLAAAGRRLVITKNTHTHTGHPRWSPNPSKPAKPCRHRSKTERLVAAADPTDPKSSQILENKLLFSTTSTNYLIM